MALRFRCLKPHDIWLHKPQPNTTNDLSLCDIYRWWVTYGCYPHWIYYAKRLSVPKVLFIPKLSMNLLSVGQLCESGLIVTFKSSGCIDCNWSKQHAWPFNISNSTTNAAFDLIHSDVWGPAPISSMGGARYYVIFVDDYTRFTWVYLWHRRSPTNLYIICHNEKNQIL